MAPDELPSGTVTLLFTDIEGSTRLLKQLGDGYGDVLADHRRLLRAAFAAHGGREIDTQGDAFFVAFSRAKDAVGAAIDGQTALAAHDWPDGADVRVRMGIHTGEPILGDEGYHGLGVHRGARICAAGHGGHILLSNATRELLDGVDFVDLGEKRLKDLDRPERIWQVPYPGAPESSAPLKTVDAQPEQLPFVSGRRPRRRTLLVAAAALVVAAGAAVVLAAGGDGNGFEVEPNSLAVLSADGRTLRKSVPTGTSPGGVAIGEGAIWVTNTGEGTLSRVDPESYEVEQTIGVGTGPAGVAVAAGFVWVVNSRDGTLSQIDPRKAGGSEVRRVTVGNQPNAITAAGDVLWVANSTDGTLSRVDARTGVAGKPIRLGAGADAVAAGADRLWVASFTSATVTEVDPKSGQVLRPISVGHGPSAVTVGAGAVWVVNALDGTVSKIDPERSSVVTTVPVGREPQGVAARGDSVWVTDEAGVLTEIDARNAEIVRRTQLGDGPGALVVGEGGIYVTVRSSGAAHRGGTLRVLAGEFDTMDPGVTYNDLGNTLTTIVGDGLVAFRRVSGTTSAQIVPDLAISLPASTDGGRTYSFRLRKGLRYSTGEAVKAGDFRRGIERSWRLHTVGSFFFGTIEGAQKCKPKQRCDLSRGIETDDAAATVTFRLREPDPDFLFKIALPPAFPVPESTPMKNVPTGVPGTGPYRVETAGEKVVLTRNPRFRRHSTAAQPETYPDRIEARVGFEPDEQLSIVERGEADVAFDTLFADPAKIQDLQTTRASQVYVHPTTAFEFVFLNTQRPPFDDVRVRRAVNFAVARNAIQRQGRDGLPTCQILPRDILGYQRSCPYPRDLRRARRLVAAAGAKGARVELWGGPEHPSRAHMLAVGRAMRAAGLRARVRLAPTMHKYFQRAHTKTLQAGWWAWILDYPSPTNVVGPLLTCGAPENVARFCDRSLDASSRRASRTQTTDQPAAAQLWARIDRAITARAPWIPLAGFARTTFVSDRVGNFQYHPQWGVLLDQLWVR